MVLILANLLVSAASYASSHSLMNGEMNKDMDVIVASEVSSADITDCHEEVGMTHSETLKKVLNASSDDLNSNCGEQQCECPDSLCHVFSSAAVNNHFTSNLASSPTRPLYNRQHNNHFFEQFPRPPKS